MKTIESLGYPIYFDNTLDSLAGFLEKRPYSKVLFLVDRNTAEYCLPFVQACLPTLADYDLIEIDPGEENKNIDFCIGVWKTMLDFGADRKSLLINLGGGVVTDLGGFAAATFKRGIDFVQIPTTLLAQVDASVGGKTGIDLDGMKNIIGTFSQPQAVFICNSFLSTLDARQLRSGWAEMIKHGLIRDAAYFERLRDLPLGVLDEDHVYRSVSIKNEIVLQDPHEAGLRKVLNYGHTVGHAVETASLMSGGDPLLHGEAIAIGMICEAYLSHKISGLSAAALKTITETLLGRFGATTLPGVSDEYLLDLMVKDKKSEQDRIGFALLSDIGVSSIDFFVEPALIGESLAYYRRFDA